ncbi:MAG: hypothetical protein IJ800_06585 [Clostridia bacterium]|nr:hypothetical protein [Clostridia bacterium]
MKTFFDPRKNIDRNGKLSGWASVFIILGLMIADQFVLDIPYENIVFPLLVIAAATLTFSQNFVLVAVYSVIYELSCIAWFPYDLYNVRWWLLSVFLGYFSTYVAYKIIFAKNKNPGTLSLAAFASVGEILYFWVSVGATCIIWKVPFAQYFLSDLPYELLGSAITFICALPVVYLYKNRNLFKKPRVANKI